MPAAVDRLVSLPSVAVAQDAIDALIRSSLYTSQSGGSGRRSRATSSPHPSALRPQPLLQQLQNLLLPVKGLLGLYIESRQVGPGGDLLKIFFGVLSKLDLPGIASLKPIGKIDTFIERG